jgi:hypothetical protein
MHEHTTIPSNLLKGRNLCTTKRNQYGVGGNNLVGWQPYVVWQLFAYCWPSHRETILLCPKRKGCKNLLIILDQSIILVEDEQQS